MLKTKILSTGIFCQGLVLIGAAGNSSVVNYMFNPLFPLANYNVMAPTEKKPSEIIEPAQKIKLNAGIEKFTAAYNQNNVRLFKQIIDRNQQHFKIMDKIFLHYGLPLELKYLAVVESKLKPSAISGAGAKGYWQLMPVTAKSLGLKITATLDERTNCYKSTVAAAKYLKELYAKFNDWLLVLAAYNGGAGTVYKAIKKSGSRDFWKLQYFLPLESRMHVKKYISTHHYFEGQGGLTTMSKNETEEHFASACKLKTSSAEIADAKKIKTGYIANKWIVIIRNVNQLALIAKI